MTKQDLGNLALRLFRRKQRRSEEEKRKNDIEEPEKPEEPVTYEQALEFKESKQEYSHKVEKIEEKISRIDAEIKDIEKGIKAVIPTSNIEIEVSGNFEGKTYDLIVEHVTNGNDRIEVQKA